MQNHASGNAKQNVCLTKQKHMHLASNLGNSKLDNKCGISALKCLNNGFHLEIQQGISQASNASEVKLFRGITAPRK